MENSNKPIYPQIGSTVNNENQLSEVYTDENLRGITKREYFAGLAMQGLMANNNSCSITHIVEMSIKTADELLKQLDRKNDNLLQEDNNLA
ncbi:hypothetical protein [Chryseobacterium sp.]|uniref:hypothetical protein n=1 Tax=Chryseobacterium sp. TaxID=1871047 RepID=UPI0035AEFDDC